MQHTQVVPSLYSGLDFALWGSAVATGTSWGPGAVRRSRNISLTFGKNLIVTEKERLQKACKDRSEGTRPQLLYYQIFFVSCSQAEWEEVISCGSWVGWVLTWNETEFKWNGVVVSEGSKQTGKTPACLDPGERLNVLHSGFNGSEVETGRSSHPIFMFEVKLWLKIEPNYLEAK